jgi:argininosuccinate lyase
LTKEIIFPAVETLLDSINILCFSLPQIIIKEDILSDSKYQYVFTVEAVNSLVNKGIPFREAYREIGKQVEDRTFQFKDFDIRSHTHEGSMGNLCNEQIKDIMDKVLYKFMQRF